MERSVSRGDGVEGCAQVRLGLLELRQTLGFLERGRLQAHLGLRKVHPQRLDAQGCADVAEEGAQHEPGQQGRRAPGE